MRDITLNRLLNNFDEVLNELRNIKDGVEAVRAFYQIEKLIEGDEKIELDNAEYNGVKYDNILHMLFEEAKSLTNQVVYDKDKLEDYKNELDQMLIDYENQWPNYKTDKKQKEGYENLKRKVEDEKKVVDGYIKQFGTKTKIKESIGSNFKNAGKDFFKTAKIREELLKRDVTRDDFKKFYDEGLKNAQALMLAAQQAYDDIEKEYASIKGEQELGKFRDALKNSTKLKRYLKITDKNGNTLDLSDDSITIDPISFAEYVSQARRKIEEDIKNLKIEIEEQQENITILERELQIIQDEEKAETDYNDVWEQDPNDSTKYRVKADFQQKLDAEKALRKRQIMYSMGFAENGERKRDEMFEKDWNDAVRRFCKHKDEDADTEKDDIEYTGADGNKVKLKYKTINTDPAVYKEYEDDIHKLNIKEYKKFYELKTLYENLSSLDKAVLGDGKDTLDVMIDLIKDKSLDKIDSDLFRQYRDREIEKKGSGKEWLKKYLGECAEYVATFHGFTNEYGVKYSTLKTAGSTLKAMEPVKGNIPALADVKLNFENVRRFLGLTSDIIKRDENGKPKFNPNPKSIATALKDIAVMAGWGVSVAVGGGLLGFIGTYGLYYAAKGIVTGANVLEAKRMMKDPQIKYDIENNLPTLGHATGADREVARRDYYKRTLKGPLKRNKSSNKGKSRKIFL